MTTICTLERASTVQASDLYRFQKVKVESNSAFKGETSWYRIGDRQDQAVLFCHVVGNGMGGVSTFHTGRDTPDVIFRFAPKRKVLNFTYYVDAGEDGPRLATIRMKASRGLTAVGPDDRALFRIVDPRKGKEVFIEDVLGGACTGYALVHQKAVLGNIGRMKRPEQPDAAPAKGILGRLRKKILSTVSSDWGVELLEGAASLADHRPLMAAMLLLVEQTIRMDQSID